MTEPHDPPIAQAGGSVLAATVFPHVLWTIALDRLVTEVTDPEGAPIILFYAPAGFGKSALLQVLENTVTYRQREAMSSDPDLRPALTIEALAALNGSFNWPWTLTEILEGLAEPGLAWRSPSVDGIDLGPLMRHRRSREMKDLVRDVIGALRDHGTGLLSMDEAGHLAKVHEIARHRDQLEILKSIANRSGTAILLAGTYEILDFRHLSSQLGRRMVEVHARRYRADVAHEYAEFRRVAREMGKVIEGGPLSIDDELLGTLYQGSLGCIGNLRNWLVRAESRLRRSEYDGLKEAIIAERWPADKLKSAAAELVAGEQRLAVDETAELAAVDDLLASRPGGSARILVSGKGATKRRGHRRPGERRPENDLVGIETLDVA